ncbi:MAG: hypothetical protein ACYDH9_17335 [Limisphaerales bacterium]
MPPDDFERLLKRQPMREVPAEWRKEILAVCAPPASRPVSWWHELLWPCPQAWAGMAAIWVISFALQLGTGGPPVSPPQQRALSQPQPVMGFAERRQLLAQLLGSAEAAPAPAIEAPKKSAPRPQSSRRESCAMA